MISFEQVLGQNTPIRILKQQYKNNKVPHCYIFSGVKGVGKETTAVAFAALLNCESPGEDSNACGHCQSCQTLEAGNNPNIIRMNIERQAQMLDEEKQGSYYKIKMIREIIRMLTLKPQSLKPRVVIIDEAELLTEEASGAFLKTLEEPPEQTVFILIAENIERILLTIRSRAQTICFRPLNIDEFKKACVNVKETVDDDDFYIYNASPGELARDSESVFETDMLSTLLGGNGSIRPLVEWIETCGQDRELTEELLHRLKQKIKSCRFLNQRQMSLFLNLMRADRLRESFVNNQLILNDLIMKNKGVQI